MKQEETILRYRRVIQRIGNSRGITLPRKIVEFLNSPVVEIKMVRRGYNIEILIERVKNEEED